MNCRKSRESSRDTLSYYICVVFYRNPQWSGVNFTIAICELFSWRKNAVAQQGFCCYFFLCLIAARKIQNSTDKFNEGKSFYVKSFRKIIKAHENLQKLKKIQTLYQLWCTCLVYSKFDVIYSWKHFRFSFWCCLSDDDWSSKWMRENVWGSPVLERNALVADDDWTVWALDESACNGTWASDKSLWLSFRFWFWNWSCVDADKEGSNGEYL